MNISGLSLASLPCASPSAGRGRFAGQAFVDALPDGISVGIEVPNRSYGPEEGLERSVAGVKRLLAESLPSQF
ncbi:MAG: hypothetical protein JWO25_3672 [Alphaproteobacteria bacterium]|nr:hypothetical protein [Alphaproteobacteria bacterium]